MYTGYPCIGPEEPTFPSPLPAASWANREGTGEVQSGDLGVMETMSPLAAMGRGTAMGQGHILGASSGHSD